MAEHQTAREASSPSEPTDQSRRQAIAKMAAYTAPVMLGMLVSEKALATSASGPGEPPQVIYYD